MTEYNHAASPEIPVVFSEKCPTFTPISTSGRPGWQRFRADLPVLSWSNGYAGKVAQEICEGFDEICGRVNAPGTRRLNVLLDVRNLSIHSTPGAVQRLSWNAAGHNSQEFEVVILAVGFGIVMVDRPHKLNLILE